MKFDFRSFLSLVLSAFFLSQVYYSVSVYLDGDTVTATTRRRSEFAKFPAITVCPHVDKKE